MKNIMKDFVVKLNPRYNVGSRYYSKKNVYY